MEVDGTPAPEKTVKWIRFTFKGDNVLVRGNLGNDREERCSYKIDATQSPRRLDIKFKDGEKPVVGVYEIKGDKLKVCLRHADASGPGERPSPFSTNPESNLILMVFKRTKPK